MIKCFKEENLNDWEDLMGIDILKNIMTNMSDKKDIPNLIIHGPTGSGKSLLSRILLKKLYGNILNQDYVMKLSVNDERGISSVREKIKSFSSNQICRNDGQVNFKVILFDQAGTLTIDAQNALRRIIETSANLTRFIFLTCNITNIIEPICSRCLILNLPRIGKKIKLEYYREMLDRENIKIKNSDINRIIQISNGDIRREKARLEILSTIPNKKVNRPLIEEYIFNNYDEKNYVNFYREFKQVKNINDLNKRILNILNNNNHIELLILNFYDLIIKDKDIDDIIKKKIIKFTYQYNKNLSYGCDTYVITLNYFVNVKNLLI
jgi:replication factor C subunit 2/4